MGLMLIAEASSDPADSLWKPVPWIIWIGVGVALLYIVYLTYRFLTRK